MQIYTNTTTITNEDNTTTTTTTSIDVYGDYGELLDNIQTEQIQLDPATNITVKMELTLGDLLLSSLILILILTQLIKYFVNLIFNRRA